MSISKTTHEQRKSRDKSLTSAQDRSMRLAVLDHATRLVLESADRLKRAGRPVPVKAMADDVIDQARRLWHFVRTGE